MSCEHQDLKAYLFGEADAEERRRIESHLGECANCREEWKRLQFTQSALRAIPDEEPPRRVAFVSDKVLAPSWWDRFWNSTPRLGFASAAVLAIALLGHGVLTQPTVTPAGAAAAPQIDTAAMEARITAEVDHRVAAAIEKASAQQQEQRIAEVAQLVRDAEKRITLQTRGDLVAIREGFEVLSKQLNVMYLARADVFGPGGSAGGQR
jgi:anti-sigma factor RsiW